MAGDLEPVPIDAHQLECLADDRMLELARLRHSFDLRVLDDQILNERLVQSDVDVAIDSRSQAQPRVVLVIIREVRTAATQRDPQRTTDDDHWLTGNPNRCGNDGTFRRMRDSSGPRLAREMAGTSSQTALSSRPVSPSDSLEARKVIRSTAWRMAFSGSAGIGDRSRIRVSSVPGATALTSMPVPSTSIARASVNRTTAALDAL